MDTVITAVQVIAIVSLLYGLATIARPFWKVENRWQGAGLAVVSAVVFSLLNTIPVARPDTVGEAEWKERVSVCEKAHAVRTCPLDPAKVAAARAELKEEAAKAKTEQTAKAAEAVVKGEADTPAAIKQAFLDTNRRLFALVKPCDDAERLAAKTRERYAGYNVASAGKKACRQASIDLGNLKFADPLPEKAQHDLNDAVACYSEAYGLRSEAMDGMMEIQDAGPTPSKVASVRDTLRFAEETWQGCMEKYRRALLANGFTDIAPVLRAAGKAR